MQIRLYTKSLNPLTTLLASDVESVEFTDKLEGDGSASFVVRADSSKINHNAILPYNRVKIFEGGVCVFFGYLTQNDYTLSTITIHANSIGYLLKNRLVGSSFVASGTISSILSTMLSTVNSADDTGITLGDVDASLTTVYNKTYTDGNDFDYIVGDLLGDAIQWRVDANGKIQVAPLLGNDLSATVKLKYDIRQVENSNITNFSVKESGQRILTKIIAKRTGGSTIVTDSALLAKYGLIEDTKTYQYVNDNTQLADKATRDLQDVTYTPDVTLSPTVEDNFSVCDILGVRLYNGFIDVATSYQILEKSVAYIGVEKTIKVKLNDKDKSLIDILIEDKKRLKLLENK